jgi:formamidopyrimidine-DNA glycosylase
MPELPDVELARRRLQDWMLGATIVSAKSADRRILRPHPPSILKRSLLGRSVRAVERRGKWLRLRLDDGRNVYSHLGMTGRWLRREPDAPREQAERVRIDLVRDDWPPISVRYVDPRRFGRLVVTGKSFPEWEALGPDPLIDGIRLRPLAQALASTRRTVKEALMDQSLLAGVGNIVATEALWYGRIDPRSTGQALSYPDVKRIARGLRTAIRKELADLEASYPEELPDAFRVYGRAGEPCPRCRSPLSRIVLGGRSTTYCGRCQERRRARGGRRRRA